MSLDRDLVELGRIPLFGALEYEARRLLAFSGETRILRQDDIVCKKGEPSDCGFVLLNGELQVVAPNSVTPAKILSPPTLVGELALLTETERPATVIARTPSAVLKITRQLFHRVLNEHPRSARQVKMLLESRLTAFASDLKKIDYRKFVDGQEL